MKKGDLLNKVYKSNLPSRAKQVMFYLINRANAEGTCFPSVKTIASDCGVTERTIQRTMKILMEEGFVAKEERYRDNGGQTSNLYKLIIDFENDNDEGSGNKDIKKENLIENKGSKSSHENIKSISFDEYKESEETTLDISEKENNCFANISRAKGFGHKRIVNKQKCHPIRHNIIDEDNITSETITINSLCHGVSDNLHPP
ncbi:putative transcriptional regulator [Clostridium sartagoforme AAU1]|uniref:Putative transcriptional regulator n=1 Tax=Clostridium sartagoforme AAU1 TaxID=1202534 RepID=R9C7G9_9CLOT|nr:helix-turn-helix domain-containing protein [Clostridium sartagoforme]EOR25257.1 putative transcriptional regulator [Clostridium sartagoforme AAU1]